MKSLLVLFLVFSSGTAVAQQQTAVHQIDKTLEACIDKDPSTAGMVRCNDRAYTMWDKELNKNYAALMQKLKPEGKQALKLAQSEWIKQRDAEFKLLEQIYSTLQGTMYIPMQIASRVEIVKQRALALSGYIELAGEAEP